MINPINRNVWNPNMTEGEESRLKEGLPVRRPKPIGNRGHLKRMLEYLKAREKELKENK